MEVRNYVSPTGAKIVGTQEILYATAKIHSISTDGEPDYTGYTEVDYDSQTTLTRGGKILFIDDDGETWTFDELEQETDEEGDE